MTRHRLLRPLPAEWLVVAAALFAASMIYLKGYPLLLPRSEGGQVLALLGNTTKYGVIVAFSVLLHVAVYLLRAGLRKTGNLRELAYDLQELLRLMLSLMLALYLMLLFKWWSHLSLYSADTFLAGLDGGLYAMESGLRRLAAMSGIPEVYYYHVYALMFIVCYPLAAALNPDIFRRMLTACIGVALLGGGVYMLLPAYGPLAAGFSADPTLADTQRVMLENTRKFRESAGLLLNPNQFESPLGAMPSLHVAQAFVIQLYLWRLYPVLGALFLPVLTFIAVFAVATRFHYLIDIPVGILVALAACWLAERGYGRRGNGSQNHSQNQHV